MINPVEDKYDALMPSKHDMMLPDIDDKVLKQIGEMEEIEHLSKGSFSSPFFPVVGTFYGINNRLMICLVCQEFNNPNAPIVNVWFLVNVAFNCNFINEKTMKTLNGSDDVPDYMKVVIQDPNFSNECYLSHSHFKEANVLGMSAILQLGVTIEGMNLKKRSFRLAKQ